MIKYIDNVFTKTCFVVLMFLASIECVMAEGSATVSKYAVDLGLPSGTLWADRNVGANRPEDNGDFFAWGETKPKSTYDWSNYKWSRDSSDHILKYCPGTKVAFGKSKIFILGSDTIMIKWFPNKKTTDYVVDICGSDADTTIIKLCRTSSYSDEYYNKYYNKTVLDAEDDAATVNMGKEWRMPTEEDMRELLGECTWTWTTQKGTEGYKVTGPNGKSIFLPAAGCHDADGYGNAGFWGCYWTASLGSFDKDAVILSIAQPGCRKSGSLRYKGLSVRAVVR